HICSSPLRQRRDWEEAVIAPVNSPNYAARISAGSTKAKNGGYVALVRPDGAIDTLWPGCSSEMMRELGRRIAELAAVTERSIDVAGMPGALATGCPFEP